MNFTFLPQEQGWLPYWQLVVATTALFNTVQNFLTLKLTKRIYSRSPDAVNALQARTFAIWTLTSAVVRAYAAYHIHEKSVYDITMFTYLIAFGHFSSEFFIFRTTRFNAPVISPFIVSVGSLVWMFTQYDYYVSN
ncbi:ergosterol biosynthesis protein [Stygiomarasmius scandens]|uniref:Ergosterol biosynthesis protein n=1 Tax=Marasmiellus scandens TaxID=2682957 RepID=A0ABR1J9E0_9AGAR